jgi:16S rRNA (cytosine967-C5)-methyltransferase
LPPGAGWPKASGIVRDPARRAPVPIAASPPDPARRAALEIVEAALARRGGLDEALGRAAVTRLDARDRAFARATAMATLRHLGPIDRLIDARLQREPPGEVRNMMRIGIAQAFWLDQPDYAAVAATVELAPQRLRGLVNAILRGALRDGPPDERPDDLAPPWLLARWRQAFGETRADAVAALIVVEPAMDLTLKDPADTALVDDLEAVALGLGTLRTRRRGDVSGWPGYGEGRWWVQDAAAAIPARLLRAQPGQTALDLCAAPGGKTLQLAAAGATVTALDRSDRRLRRVVQGLQRTGLAAETLTADAGDWSDPRTFDAVLLDAPCTATGTFRRNPDVLWNVRPGDVAALAQEQKRLLAAAAARVKPGGRLIYSVCSLEPEEGEAQIAAFLAAHPEFEIDPIASGEGGAPAPSVRPEGWLRILPSDLEGGLDGFFVARLRRAV